MWLVATDRVEWSVISLSIMTASPAKPAKPIEMLFAMLMWVGSRNHMLRGGPDHPCDWVNRQSLYSECLSRRQHKCSANASWVYKMWCTLVQLGEYDWTVICGTDAALCQITLTSCCGYASRPGSRSSFIGEPLRMLDEDFLRGRCLSCCPANSIKAMKGSHWMSWSGHSSI